MKHELTITLKPHLYTKTARDQFRLTKDYILDILKPYKHTTVCELTANNNVHYHSLLDIEGIVEKDILLNRIRPYKAFGRLTCTAVQYVTSYEEYIMKSIMDTTRVINEFAVIKDDYQLTPPINIFTNGGSPLKRLQDGAEGGPSRDNIYKGVIPAERVQSTSATEASPSKIHTKRKVFIIHPSIYEDQ